MVSVELLNAALGNVGNACCPSKLIVDPQPVILGSRPKSWSNQGVGTYMRIGLFLENLPEEGGGGFQQSLSTVESLVLRNTTKHEFVVFTPFERTRQRLLKHGIAAIRYRHRVVRLIDRWSATALGNSLLRRLRRLGLRRLGRHLDALLDDHGIHLVLLTAMAEATLRIGDHPFIVTVWDVSHRDYPEFPDGFANRVFERRERALRATLTRALAVIVDSAFGARCIASSYHVDPGRIIVLPYLPSHVVRCHAKERGSATADWVRRKYNLPAQYVFYPAFFAEHKNHLYLLEGLVELEQRHGIAMHAVFCGGDPIDQKRVERQVQALGLAARVRILGYVPDEDVPALYERALALVMPTYTGPANIPPLEAATLGCPVIYSDLPWCRDQMGDAALYCDLNDISSLADHLAALTRDPAQLDSLRKAGYRLAAEIAKIDYGERLSPVLDRYAYTRRRWAWPRRTQ
jgi:glycosyltransferase involved in cell wall biosynthesis